MVADITGAQGDDPFMEMSKHCSIETSFKVSAYHYHWLGCESSELVARNIMVPVSWI